MTTGTERPLKAYRCTHSDEETMEIVFATSNGAAGFPIARADGCHISEVEVRRAPEFDAHAPGPVPVSSLFAAGWWFECAHCYRRLSLHEGFVQDHPASELKEHAARQAPHVAALARFDRDDPRPPAATADLKHAERWRADRLVEDWHRRRHELSRMVDQPILSRVGIRIDDDEGLIHCDTRCEQARHGAIAGVDLAHAEAEMEARRRWPGCPSYVSSRWPNLEPCVTFHPPGLEHPVRWTPKDDDAHVATTDMAAWTAFLDDAEEGDGRAKAA